MIDYGHELQFGIFAMPSAERPGQAIAAAKLADVVGLDLVTFQDHPYQARFLDTWTLLSFVAAETETVRLAPNVANLPLRNPAVLARERRQPRHPQRRPGRARPRRRRVLGRDRRDGRASG